MVHARQLIRSLGHQKGSSAVLVLLCALGVALSTTIFAVVKTVLLDPLPYRDADRLVAPWGVAESFGIDRYPFSWENYRDYRDQVDALEDLAAWRTGPFTLEGADTPVSVTGARITENFLDVLGVDPILGSRLGAEGVPERGVAMIGHSLWQRQFGGAPDVLGQTIRLDGNPHEIVGVLPPQLRYPTPDTQVFIPLIIEPPLEPERGFHFLRLVGRLQPDRTLEQAEAEAVAVAAQLAEAFPDDTGELSIRITSLKEEIVGTRRASLGALFAAVQALFLIAWANMAILLLARGMARRGELELRVALGATRSRLMGLLLGEALTLAGVGCALGLGAGWLAVNALPSLDPGLLPRAYELRFDASLVSWAAGLTLLGAFAFGSVPAWTATRSAASGAAATRTTDRRSGRFNTRLVAVQVALTLPLLAAAGMQIRSVRALLDVDLGFPVEGALTAGVALPRTQFGPAEQKDYIDRALPELRRLPGVESVAVISHLPLTRRAASIVTYRPDQQGQSGLPNAHYRVVSPGLLSTLGIPIVAGREVEQQDEESDRRVLVVDETLAEALWPGRDPIGEKVLMGNAEEDWEVIGVAAAARILAIDQEPTHAVYVPAAKNTFVPALSQPRFVLRTGIDPEGLARSVRGVLQRVAPRQAVLEVRPLRAQVDDWLGDRRALGGLLWAIALAALALAAAGMYATLSFAVGRRLREMAIRKALGAGVRALARSVVIDGLKPGLAGALGGLAICVAGGQYLTRFVYGVPAVDLRSLTAAIAMLLGAALVASSAPALRAVRESPARLMREDQLGG